MPSRRRASAPRRFLSAARYAALLITTTWLGEKGCLTLSFSYRSVKVSRRRPSKRATSTPEMSRQRSRRKSRVGKRYVGAQINSVGTWGDTREVWWCETDSLQLQAIIKPLPVCCNTCLASGELPSKMAQFVSRQRPDMLSCQTCNATA